MNVNLFYIFLFTKKTAKNMKSSSDVDCDFLKQTKKKLKCMNELINC